MVLAREEKRLQAEVEAAAAATERVQAVLRQVGALRACVLFPVCSWWANWCFCSISEMQSSGRQR